MIRRIAIQGYKSFHDVELELDQLTVIIGPNASGKSNLFDALKLLSRVATERSLADAFSDHRGDPIEAFDYSRGGIEGLLQQERLEFAIEVDVELSQSLAQEVEKQIRAYRTGTAQSSDTQGGTRQRVKKRLLRYRVSVEMMPKTGILRVCDESLCALREEDGQLRPDERRKPFLERVEDRLRLRLEGQARPTEYELGLNYTLVSQPLYPPHYPHITAFREEVSRWRFYYLEPRLMREESPLKAVNELTSSGGDMAAFYYTLCNQNGGQFENLQKTLSMLVPGVDGMKVIPTEKGRLQLRIWERGVPFSAKVLSEGTLRLLGLLAILSPTNPATVVGLEEPENGVHPRRLRLIAELLQNASEHKQVIVNTHSPLLPDYFNRARFVRCVKHKGHTLFEPLPFRSEGDLFQRIDVEEALEETPMPMFHKMLRGDFDA